MMHSRMRFSFWLRSATERIISLLKYVLERLGFVEHFESIRLRKFPKTTTFDSAAKFDNAFMYAIWGGRVKNL